MNFDNKTVVVTGAAGGIGRVLCSAAAAKGANVVVSDLDLDSANEVANSIGAIAVQCDVSDEASINALIDAAEAAYGRVDLFCSNAGFGVGEPTHAASASNEVWERSWRVHVMSHVYASRALLPKMIARGDGYLLSIASAAGVLTQVADVAYTATKHAAVALAESLAISHADQGVKVSVACPSYVNTSILSITDEQRNAPMIGVLTPEECVESIIKGVEAEQFLILPHAQVWNRMQHRASNAEQWIIDMRRYRASLIDSDGKVDFSRMVLKP